MKNKLDLHEVKKVELDILKFIDSVCTEHNLRYYAAYGTLLGAVRHNGFIPWDDDIDIYMPRDDFNKFTEIVKGYDNSYVLSSIEDDDYYHAFAKLSDGRTIFIDNTNDTRHESGIWVDIFILDGLPDDIRKARQHFKKCHRLTVVLYGFINNKFPKDKRGIVLLKSIIAWFFSGVLIALGLSGFIKKRYKKLSEKYAFDESKIVFPEGCCYGIKEIYDKSIFDGESRILFEDINVRIPINYNDCLTKCYGNYMDLPPEDKRIPSHTFTAYWKR